YHYAHAECLSIASDLAPDVAIAEDAQRATVQRSPQSTLPVTSLHRCDLLRNEARRGQDQSPRQLCCRGGARIERRGIDNSDPMTGAGCKIYMRSAFAGLHDEAQVRQECQQLLIDGGAFANQH